MRVAPSTPLRPTTPARNAGERSAASPTGAKAPDADALIVSLSDAAEQAQQAARDSELDGLRARLPTARRRAEMAEEAAEEARAAERGELNDDEQEELDELQQADRDVRSHEAAHVAAASGLARTPRYKTVTGPDGRQYAIGGSVSIDMSPGATPEATAHKMRTVRAAATAVSDPSAADSRVANAAAQQLRNAEHKASRRASAVAAYQKMADLPHE